MQNGYQVIQVSAIGRRSIGVLWADRRNAELNAERLNNESTGERYEVCWFIGMPRK